MKCTNCNYEWETKSELMYVSCPSCRLKVKNDNKVKIKEKKNERN